MTTSSGKQLAVGLRSATVFALNSSGTPLAVAPAATPYEGLSIRGAKAFDLQQPQARKISHSGEDRVMMVDFLPAIEAGEAVIRASVDDQDLIALLSNVKKVTVGEATGVAIGTDQQGFEPSVALLLYQQSKDLSLGIRRWRSYIVPSAICYPISSGMNDSPQDETFQIALSPTTKHLWGTALAALTEGATSMQVFKMMTEGRPNIVAWLGDGTEDEFLLPVAKPALSTTKMTVWVNDVVTTTGITKAVTKLAFTAAPTSGDRIVCFYEW